MARKYAGRLALCVLAGMLALPAWAEEITVKNDSVVDFGEAVIVGDFIAGERAGVQLTSPCNGTIVAIQVLWLQGTPGHLASVEEAIYIYGAGAFPVPGSELELLEAPVLEPGYLNEYRYLDEAQQVPLEVPIGAGDKFYVVLEFANATDVGNGGPSVVRDVGGCSSDANVLYGDIGLGMHWYNFCLIISGDIAIRAIIDCPGATGACCYTNGNCSDDIEEDDCVVEFGATWYEEQTCAEVTCIARGACCRDGGCLQLVDEATCVAIGGVYAGDGTDCDDDVCETGACCMLDGSCDLVFGFECDALGGTYQGVGTSCDPNPCPQPRGACCFGTVCIANQTEANCGNSGGDWAGAGTDCTDGDDDGTADACEPEENCRGDSNCDGGLNFDDIDYFVAAIVSETNWEALFTGVPPCEFINNDCNWDGSINFDDIDPFVDGLVGGECIPEPT